MKEVACTVYGVLYRILKTCQCLGVAPIKFSATHGGHHVGQDNTIFIISRMVYFVIVTWTAIFVFMQFTSADYGSNVLEYSWLALATSVTITLATLILTAPSIITRNLQVVAKINELQGTRNKDDVSRSSSYVQTNFVLLIICTTITLAVDATNELLYFLENQTNILPFAFHFLLYMPFYSIPLIILLFVNSVMGTLTIVKSVNREMFWLLEGKSGSDQDEQPQGANETTSKCQDINRLAAMSATISEIIIELNSIFGLNLILIIACCFVGFITIGFFITISMIINEAMGIISGAAVSIWFVLYTMWLASLIEPCHKTHEEMKTTMSLVNKLSTRYKDKFIRAELEKFNQFLILDKISFCPMDLFVLDRYLVATITTTVSTYIIIVIQFETLDDNRI